MPLRALAIAIALSFAGWSAAVAKDDAQQGGRQEEGRVIERGGKRYRVIKGERHRNIPHWEAYERRHILGGHMNIKVTPPELRGRKGYVAVEIYNYSKVYLSIVDFWMTLYTDGFSKIEAHITVEDMRENWGDIRWIKIPGSGKISEISRITVEKMQMFDKRGKRITIPYTTDLIKR